jgi:hypothetical protein
VWGSDVPAEPPRLEKPQPTEPPGAGEPGKPRSRGPEAKKFKATVEAMRGEIASKSITLEQLGGMLEKELAHQFKVSRDVARKARNHVLAGTGEPPIKE